MAIINFSFDHNTESYAEGAYCPISSSYSESEKRIILWETYSGLCISEREYNGYNDSDFYMTVWDTEKNEPKQIMFATTRGWSYPAYGSYVDATSEIQEKYKAWKTAADRRYRIIKRWNKRKEQNELANATGLSRKQLNKLSYCLSRDDYTAVIRLLKTRNFRSKFRKSCAEQVRKWVAQDKPQYRSPLSYKQLSYL